MLKIPSLPRLVAVGLALGVAVIVAVGFLSEESGDAAASNKPQRVQPQPTTQKIARPNIDVLVSEILARPLFNPSRQPADEPAGQMSDEAAAPLKLPGRLEGVTIGPEAKEALFERDGEKPIVVKEGQKIEGWTVALIQADQVLLKSGTESQVVKPADGSGIRAVQMQAMNKRPTRAKQNPVLGASAGPVTSAGQSRPATQPLQKPAQTRGRIGR